MPSAPERPPFVQAAIDGRFGPLLDVAAAPFVVEDLIAEAELETGHDAATDLTPDAVGDDPWREPLDVLVNAVDGGAPGDGPMHVLGRWRFRAMLVRLLANRMKITHHVRTNPAIPDERIEAPIVVTGSPRSGSSIIHQLLATDPAVRAPRGWEYFIPLPPPLTEAVTRNLIAVADREIRLTATFAPAFDGMHEMRSTSTRECVGGLNHAFRSEDFEALYPVRTYAEWLFTCDKLPAMRWHKLIMQLLQVNTDRRQWVLKNPAYLGWMDALIETYPDATLVITHRDPLTMLSSVTSLYATMHSAHGDQADAAEMQRLGHDLTDRHWRMLDGLVDWVDAHPDVVIHHIDYDAFIADQIGAIGGIYATTGRPFTADVQAAMSRHLQTHPQGRHGGHRHSFEALGLDYDATRRRFARYQERFGVRSTD